MTKKRNLQNQRFGRLTVLERAESIPHHSRWKCRCDCGNILVTNQDRLLSGVTKSCGHCAKYVDIGNGALRCMLPNGKSFLIDKQDYPVVSQHRWHVDKDGRVATTFADGKSTRLHRYILGRIEADVDHINGDPTDNRRCNLRFATRTQNNQNMRLRSDNSTGYKGVCCHKKTGKYLAYINANGKRIHLGSFTNPEEAAEAYDKAAIYYFGEFAKTNEMLGNYDAQQGGM